MSVWKDFDDDFNTVLLTKNDLPSYTPVNYISLVKSLQVLNWKEQIHLLNKVTCIDMAYYYNYSNYH